MTRPWNERGTYGNIVKHLITTLIIEFDKEKDRIKKTKIAKDIGYLCQVQSSLISSDGKIEERLEELEKRLGASKK